MKYNPVLTPDLYVRTVGAITFRGGGVAKRLAPQIAGTFGGLYAAARSIGATKSADVQVVADFDDRFDDHWARVTKDGKLRFLRDAKTLRWRYSDHPLYDYTTLVALNAGTVVGYAVLSKRHLFDTDALLICDLCAAGENPGVQNALLDAVRSQAKSQGAPLIVTQALCSSQTAQSLCRMGFVKVPPRVNPKQFRMVGSGYTNLGATALDPEQWAFSWGDMDVI
jgi:hypothetical protein